MAHTPLDTQVITTEEGATFQPWSDADGALGFKVTSPAGDVRYVVLNPSGGTGDDGATPANIFLYISKTPHWADDAGYSTFFDLFTGTNPED